MLKKLSTIPIITCFMLIDALGAFAQQAQTPAGPQPPQGPLAYVGRRLAALVDGTYDDGSFRYLLHRDDVSDDGRWNDALASARPRSRPSEGALCAG